MSNVAALPAQSVNEGTSGGPSHGNNGTESPGQLSLHEMRNYEGDESFDNGPKDDQPVPYTDDRDVEARGEEEDVTDDDTLQSSVNQPAQQLNLYGVSDWQFFMAEPFYTDVIYENNTSEARDLDAAERNFLSMLRTSMYIGLAGMVVLLNYRLDSDSDTRKPAKFDSKALSLTLGSIFLVLCLGSLVATSGYVHIVTGYAKQRSLVHNSSPTLIVVILCALTVLAANILYLIQD